MSIKDILLHLDAGASATTRLDVAAGLAARFGAHLTALHCLDLPTPEAFSGYPAAFTELALAEEVASKLRAARLAEAKEVEGAFHERLRRDGLSGEWRIATTELVDLGDTVALHGRYADLIVVGQPDPSRPRAAGVPLTALMASGRPLLVVPFAGKFPTVGRNVVVGWNATPEAARAVGAALPLLHGADRVTVLAINPRRGIRGDGDLPAADLALHLARHGITAEAAHTVTGDLTEGDALLSYAADLGADLLVTGLYGHSPLRELAFGGVTRTLLEELTIPAFMMH
jgi:nucleotide-binding universal stress UspA family protein